MARKLGKKKLKKSMKKLVKARIEHREKSTKNTSLNPVCFPALEALGFKYFRGFKVEEAD